MKRFEQWAFIIIILPFLFIFQNCERNLATIKQNSSTQSLQSLENMGISHLRLPASKTSGPALKSGDEESILIDIYQSTVESSSGKTFCPGYNFFYSLQDILQDASLCTSGKNFSQANNKNTVCTMEYKLPTAILESSNGNTIELGIKNQNCQKVDLCSPYKEDFELLIRKFLEVKEMLACK